MKAPSPFINSGWIWPESHHWDIHNSYALFRKALDLRMVPSRAPLFITADQSYQLFINGRFICRGPARGFQSRWPYDEIDVRAYLKKGRNLIAIRAFNPGYSNFQYLTQGYAGILVAARWGKILLRSDESWKTIRQKSVCGDTVPTSLQLFGQEHIDLRKEAADWMAADFDDGAWLSPIKSRWNSAPWFSLEPRNIPMLAEREIAPVALVGTNEGVNAPGYERVRDVVALRFQEDRSHRSTHPPFAPLTVSATGKGKFRSYLFDFGRTVVGNAIFKISGARGGEIIDTHYVEMIDPATLTPDLIMPVHSRTAFGDRLICRPGNFAHRFFHHYGFRYLAVTVRDVEADLKLNLELSWLGYPLEIKGRFQSSDADLERIWKTCAWTQQCCSLDAYVDTPWREQAQWWGDARVQAWNTFYLSNDARLFRRGIAQIAAQTTPDGVTYGHAPTMAHNCILPDFTLIWMLTLWDYYWQTGSLEPLQTHHATVQGALDYFRQHTNPRTGLVDYDERFWLFLDWTDIFKDGGSAVYNLWLVIALDKLALLYRKAKRPMDAEPLESWSKKLRVSLGRLIDKKSGLLCDGFDGKGRIVRLTSVHSQTLALMANLKGISLRTALEQIVLPVLQTEIDPKVTPSAYWITYVFTLLSDHGHERQVVDFIKKHWTPMADHGTTWESFSPGRGDTSSSHAWSAHPLYHLMQMIGGIRQTKAAWSEITFRPVFHGTHAQTSIPTPYGDIRSQWKRKREKVEVNLWLPPGVSARIELPGAPLQTVTQGGKWIVTAPAQIGSLKLS